jgi:hypothetical protein
MRRDRGILVALFVGGIVVRGSPAHAQSDVGTGAASDAAPSPVPHSVDVTIIGGGNEADPLMDTVRELCWRLNLAVSPHFIADPEQTGNAPPGSTDMSVRIDFASRYEAVITVRHDLAEVRRTISRNASPSIVREEIADAVRSAVEAQLLWDEARPAPPPPEPIVSIAPPPPPAPLPAPIPDASPPKPVDRRFALDLTTLAGGGPVASGSPFVARVGGGVVFASRLGHRPSLTLTASYAIPFESSFGNVVTSQTDIVSIRAVPAIEIFHSSWIALGVGAGGGVDVITLQPSATQPLPPPLSITIKQVRPQIDPIVTALATAEVGLAPGVAFTLVVGSDFDLAARRYYVDGAGNGQDLLVPWRVRPVAMAGFTFTAVGAGLFASRSTP